MTEAEWLACRDPDALLDFLRHEAFGRRGSSPSRRKLRLFACACCRRAWAAITDERSRRAVAVAERYADRRVSRQELALAFVVARTLDHSGNAAFAAATACAPRGNPDRAARHAALAGDLRRWGEERAAQADLVRDIFGNPFLPVPAIEAGWLSGKKKTVLELARTIYDDEAFSRLPLLAAALVGAGCTSDTLLGHLGSPGPHARGCWVLDLLLARE